MGIPRLIGHLEPFAETVHFTERNAANPRRVAVDGPGLAFHAAQLALRKTIETSSIRTPSYREIGDAALGFLRSLRVCGLSVCAIYFDGFLPDYKKEERLQRLLNSTAELDSSRPNAQRLTRGAPFIVPVVLEILFESEFHLFTAVMPGEADSWCARHARDFGSMILTGDSDLLAHDLGTQGSVAFFPYVDINDSGVEVLEYRPTSIANRLGLASIRSLAYQLLRDRHKTMNELVELAKALERTSTLINLDDHGIPHTTEDGSIYNISIYAQDRITAGFESADSQQLLLQSILSRLDPRISEFVQQVLSCPLDRSLLGRLTVYLPVLIENVDRASAWNCGEQIRQFGYSIVTATLTIKPVVIHEVIRSGRRIVEKERQLFCYPMLIATFTEHIKTWLRICSELPPPCTWRLFGVYSMWQDLSVTDQAFLQLRVNVQKLLGSRTNAVGQYNWDTRHIDAQLQAVLYSLRMLQRFTTVFMAHRVAQQNDDFTKGVRALHDSLNSLPPLDQLIQQDYKPALEENPQLAEAITEMYALLGVEEKGPETAKPKKTRRSGKAKQSGQEVVVGGNMYHLLDELTDI
ncbi:uncharacterized protein BDZ99DRAFT_232111 [Mytilinidion resinicola]|uniref:Asteroid domain-containing protein n=1 Tax=Mytilinidion resinicola TaxID=574789 RepID=A0A6A6YYY0_9PEZI|nr:uncharacterized protein BDZ99DRAFT_232111 [Mytilinidion resinicola]KAF2814146.1 hypothetical protein BDZ99DRAFT_232111 [Mytilinidion resinicola]